MAIAESKRKGNDKYNMKCDYISLRPLKPAGERIRRAAKESGQSLQGYVLDAVDRRIAAEEAGGGEVAPELVTNLITWLRSHGHTSDDIVDCMEALCVSASGTPYDVIY